MKIMEELDLNITTMLKVHHGEKAFFTDPVNIGKKRRGWGAVKVKAPIGETK